MKQKILQDERVLSQKRKIGSDAFAILWLALLVSTLIQQYLFDAPFAQYAVEIVLFIAASVYVLVRNLLAGNDLFGSEKSGQRSVIVNTLVCGATVSAIVTVLNQARYGGAAELSPALNMALVASVTFLSASLTAFIPLELLYLANRKRQRELEQKLDDDE